MSVLKSLFNKRRLSQIIIVAALVSGIFIYVSNMSDQQHKPEIVKAGDALPDIELLDLNGEATTVQAAINSSAVLESATESDSSAALESATESDSSAALESATESDSSAASEPVTESDSSAALESATESDSSAALESVTESDSSAASKPATAPDSSVVSKYSSKSGLSAASESSISSAPMLINLWASWCKPCVNELPLLNEAQAFAPEVKFVAVNMNEELDRIEPFIERYDLTMTMLRDEQLSWKQALAAQGYPVTVLVDSQGIIQHIHAGAYTSIEEILQHTAKLVAGQELAS